MFSVSFSRMFDYIAFRELGGMFCLFYSLRWSSIEVTGSSEEGDVRGCPLTAIMVLDS